MNTLLSHEATLDYLWMEVKKRNRHTIWSILFFTVAKSIQMHYLRNLWTHLHCVYC